jgi:hypothetical protein
VEEKELNSEENVMRSAMYMVLALASQLIGDAPLPAQKILEENPYYLRADKKLQVSLRMEANHPKLSQIIAALHDATGLDIAIDERLQGHDPDFGYIQPSRHGYHAWQIMEMIAKKDLQHGYWEKTEEGYRLTGSMPLPTVSKGNPLSQNLRFAQLLWTYFLSLAPLVVVLAIVLIRRRRQTQRAGTKGEQQTDAQSTATS